MTASYSYVQSTEPDPTGGRADVPLTPRHSAGITGVWEKEGVARVGLECFYTGEQRLEYNPFRTASRPYVSFGAMGERKISAHAKLFVNLENLGNVRQTHWDPLLLPSRSSDGQWTLGLRSRGALLTAESDSIFEFEFCTLPEPRSMIPELCTGRRLGGPMT